MFTSAAASRAARAATATATRASTVHAPSHLAPRVHRAVTAAVTLGVGVGLGVTLYLSSDLRQRVADTVLVHAQSSQVAQAQAPRIPDSARPSGFRIETETSTRHPVSISFGPPVTPSPITLSLVGVGARKVSFLRVKVYSAAFYLDPTAAAEAAAAAGSMAAVPAHAEIALTSVPGGEAFARDHLVSGACAVRIVPVRNTDFSHLRDGLTRALLARQKLAKAAASKQGGGRDDDEDEDERIGRAIQAFKALFPAGSVAKGKALTLIRSPSGQLIVDYQGRLLGSVNDPWVGTELFLSYFADKDVISPPLKADVAKGLEQLAAAKLDIK